MPDHTTPAIQFDRFSSVDADEGHDFIRKIYVEHDVSVRGATTDFQLSIDHLQIGPIFHTRVQHSMAVTITARSGLTWHAITSNRLPTMAIDSPKRLSRLGAGDAVALNPGTPCSLSWDVLDSESVALDDALLRDVAAPMLDRGQSFVFDPQVPVSPVVVDHWRRTVALVRRVALANASKPDVRLLADELARLLTSTALVCFPNNSVRDTASAHRDSPASLRRAKAFIDTPLDQPVTLLEIAEAARVSPRALQETFQRHLEVSPMGYLRRGRLARVHRDLEAAQPGDGQTVTSIAARWGFFSLPRFGVVYRRTYGVPPSHTLRG